MIYKLPVYLAVDIQVAGLSCCRYIYLLTVIDIFSKFVWIVPLKRKTGQEVANTFSSILKERRPSKTWVDRGWEFYNKDVQKLVELYSTENEDKSCVIERFNRTIKEKNV